MANITFTEGSGLQDSIFGKSQAPIRMFIEKRGEAFEAQSMLPNLFDIESSTHWGEKLTSMTSMEGFKPVGENGAYPVDGFQEGYSKFLEHMTWKNSFALSREIIEDSKLMDLKRQPEAFTAGYYRTREKFGAALLGAAMDKAYNATDFTVNFAGKKFSTASADGCNLFSMAHTSKTGGASQTNLFDEAFSADALAALEVKMQGFTDDNGEILDVVPDTIVIPNDYALKKAVFAAIGADKDPDTANNGFNFTYGRWNVIVWPYLNQFIGTNTNAWVLMDSRYNKEYGGAVWFDRVPLEVRSEIAENDANVWKGYARFTAGFNDWRFAAVSGISSGSDLIA